MHGRTFGCLCALAGVALAPLTARADEASAIPSFAVSIRSASGHTLPVAFRRFDAERWAPPIAECTTPCTLELPKAVYRVEIHDGPDGEPRRKLVLENKTDLSVIPKDKVASTAGLALGIGGPVMFASGLALFAVSTGLGMPCTGECSPSPSWEPYLGLSLMVAGLIATPTGWIMYVTSKARIKNVTSATTAGRPTFALVPVRGGVGLSGGFAF